MPPMSVIVFVFVPGKGAGPTILPISDGSRTVGSLALLGSDM